MDGRSVPDLVRRGDPVSSHIWNGNWLVVVLESGEVWSTEFGRTPDGAIAVTEWRLLSSMPTKVMYLPHSPHPR